eukprot:2459447-Pleurochrysis_carterae.AAC.2
MCGSSSTNGTWSMLQCNAHASTCLDSRPTGSQHAQHKSHATGPKSSTHEQQNEKRRTRPSTRISNEEETKVKKAAGRCEQVKKDSARGPVLSNGSPSTSMFLFLTTPTSTMIPTFLVAIPHENHGILSYLPYFFIKIFSC